MGLLQEKPEASSRGKKVSYTRAVLVSCIFALAVIFNIQHWVFPGQIKEDEQPLLNQDDTSEFAWHHVSLTKISMSKHLRLSSGMSV